MAPKSSTTQSIYQNLYRSKKSKSLIQLYISKCFLCLSMLNRELMWQQKVISCGFAIKNQ